MIKTRVAIIYGGRSGEHEVSLRSAKSIIDAMDTEKYKVLHYLISKEGKWSPRALVPEPNGNAGIDVVFPVLHGTFGEDGTLQGLLELADLPYVGAGVLASAASMDKEVMKRLAKERGLPVVDYQVFSSRNLSDIDGICSKFEFPVFVKPANLGSSVGISKARNCVELKAAVRVLRTWQRRSHRGRTVRDSTLQGFLRLRRQVFARESGDCDPGEPIASANRGAAGLGRKMLSGSAMRRNGARGFSARKREQPSVH